MKCPFCNKEIEDGLLFCGECGEELSEENIRRKKAKGAKGGSVLLAVLLGILVGGAAGFFAYQQVFAAETETVNQMSQITITAEQEC